MSHYRKLTGPGQEKVWYVQQPNCNTATFSVLTLQFLYSLNKLDVKC